MAIKYYTEDCTFNFRGKRKITKWIEETIRAENGETGEIGVYFCSDPYILMINREYLHHDYFTDIITFDYTDNRTISGELMISIDTVRENAKSFGVTFHNELSRVIIHGILHLLGYGDKTPEEEKNMRVLEDKYLNTKE